MFELENGRKHFYQWDTGQRLIINDATVIEAHFCNRTGDCSLTCEAYTDGGKRVVNVPNILLQDDWDIRVYAFCGNYTKVEERFEVVKRSKPADYVYTETEVKSWDVMEDRVDATLSSIERLGVEVSSAETQRETAEAQRIAAEDARKAAAAEMETATQEAQKAAAEAQTAVETLLNNAHAPAIVNENTASIVAIDDAAAAYAVGATTHFVATQEGSGDASPTNIRPIVGYDTATITRTGKNLLGFNDYNIPTSTATYIDSCSNGMFRREVKGTHTTTYALSNPAMAYIINPNIKAGTYTYTLKQTAGTTYYNPYLEITLNDGTIVKLENGVETTIPQDGTITGVRMASKQFNAGDVIEFVLQLEAGAGTEYEQYNGAALTAELPETIYGGNLDWDTGLLTITHRVKTFDGTESWTKSGDICQLQYVFSDGKGYTANEKYYHISSHYKATHWRTASTQIDLSCYTLNNSALLVKDSTKATVDEFKAYLAEQANEGKPFTLIQPLKPAHYKTIQLSAQQLEMLKGYNAVWSDSGNTDLAYIADTKLYIDGKFTALQNAIVSLGSNV